MALGKKILKVVLFVVILVPAIILFLNYFLAHRLEKYLKKELISRVVNATDNFYTLSYDALSIDLFSGELKIEGIDFKPDSVTFDQWKLRDSLPETYMRAKIGAIDFKGLNLIWRWSYKHLNFNTFEIQSPVLEIYNAYNTSRFVSRKVKKNTEIKSLYELIEPYINVLTVNTLNLEHAFVSYHVENPQTPIVYQLEDVSFHAYGFRLDSLSYESGKLLYSDNFDFVTNQNQTLFTNNEFLLQTDSIRLSTQDSIIYLENIQLVPQEELWNQTRKTPSNYVDGQIEKVQVDGIYFTREKALNYLKANTFGIYSPDIKVYNLSPGKRVKAKEPVQKPDSLMQALSLYDMISPILHRVSIDLVSLENTKADYYYASNGFIDTYHLKEFNFHAYNFLVDSLSDAEGTFWYSENFVFDAKGLEGTFKAGNHKISVDLVNLDTEKKSFYIDNVRLHPITTRTQNDYMEGSIRSVRIEGLAYDNGISADLLEVKSPDIRYVQAVTEADRSDAKSNSVNTSQKKPDETGNPTGRTKNQSDVELMLNPLLSYLSIRTIRIDGANMIFCGRNEEDTTNYRIKDFNFYAKDFLIDERTINRKAQLFFDYKHFGFAFRNFDNYMFNKAYRLMVGNTTFSTTQGLRFEDIALIPLQKKDVYFSVKVPSIELTSSSWTSTLNSLFLGMHSVSLDRFRMMNAEVGIVHKNMTLNPVIDLDVKGLYYEKEKNYFDVKDISFHTQNINMAFGNGLYNLYTGDIRLNNNELRLTDIRLESPFSKEEFSFRHPKHAPRLDLKVRSFSLRDINTRMLINERKLVAGSASVQDVTFEVYKNKKIPIEMTYKPMINEYFQKLPFPVDIDSLTIRNMDFTFELLPLKGKQTGKLFFADINGVLHKVTNIAKRSDQYMILNAGARFMDNGFFTTEWKFPVDSANKRFFLDAHMSEYDFTTLNTMIAPAAPIRILSGKVNDLTFSINGTDRLADIEMRLLYDGLKVDLVKEKDGKLVERRLPSALINGVVRNSNPRRPNRKPHVSRITSIERDLSRSTFYYIWTILRPAMGDAVGVSEGTQEVAAEIAEFVKTIKSLFHHKEKDEPEHAE